MKTLLNILTLVTFVTGPVLAAVTGEVTQLVPVSAPQEMPDTGIFSVENMNKIMPKNLTENSDPEQVQKDILNKSLDVIVKSEVIENTGIAKTAQKIETTMNTEVKMQSEEGIEHKVKMKVLAFQAAAQINYSGLLNASATYKPTEDNVDFTVTEKISANAQLQLKHETHRDLSSVNVQLDW